MPWTSWKLPGSSGAMAGPYGSQGWSGTSAIEADDGSAATSTASSGGTQLLWFRDFGFTTADVPSGSVITGVQGRAKIRRTNVGGASWAFFALGVFTTSTPTSAGDLVRGVEIQGGGVAIPSSYTLVDGGDDSNNSLMDDSNIRSNYFGGYLAAGFTGGGTASVQVDYVAARAFYLTNTLKVRDGGTWKTPDPKVRHSGTWKTPSGIWVKDGGVWKQVYG